MSARSLSNLAFILCIFTLKTENFFVCGISCSLRESISIYGDSLNVSISKSVSDHMCVDDIGIGESRVRSVDVGIMDHDVWAALTVMITSSNGNIFHVTGPLCGEFTSHQWITHTKASDTVLWFFSWICAWINGWVNNREAGDLRCNRANYDVTEMVCGEKPCQ